MVLSPDKHMSRRIWAVQILLIGGLVLLGIRAVSVQILQGDLLSRRAENTYVRSLTFRGYRGLILDRNFHELGASIDAKSLIADPVQVKDPRDAAKILGKILSMDPAPLEKRLSTNRRFALIARDISPDQVQAVKQAGLTGMYFEKDFKRFYPNRDGNNYGGTLWFLPWTRRFSFLRKRLLPGQWNSIRQNPAWPL